MTPQIVHLRWVVLIRAVQRFILKLHHRVVKYVAHELHGMVGVEVVYAGIQLDEGAGALVRHGEPGDAQVVQDAREVVVREFYSGVP